MAGIQRRHAIPARAYLAMAQSYDGFTLARERERSEFRGAPGRE
jgi:hypothetical protein